MDKKISKIGIYGTGKVALSFGNFLIQRGFKVGYYGRSIVKAQGLIKKIGALSFDVERDLLTFSDAVCFCISDSAIAEVSESFSSSSKNEVHVSGAEGFNKTKQPTGVKQKIETEMLEHQQPKTTSARTTDLYAFHMSGALAADEIKGDFLTKFSLHPLRAFATVENDLTDTTFALEIDRDNSCNPRCIDAIDEFVDSLDTKIVRLRSDQKTLYHAAAAMASNLVVPLYYEATEILKMIGLDDETLLLPLIYSAIDNIAERGLSDALTGPIARGDALTVEKHMAELEGDPRNVYQTMSRIALLLSKVEGDKKQRIKQILDDAS